MTSTSATVRLGRRRQGWLREAVLAFPRDRAFGSAMGQRRWLRVVPEVAFRPIGFLVWGVSQPPPRPPTPAAPDVPPDFSWCHRFTIGGKDRLVLAGGFGLHYFRIPATFQQLTDALRTSTGEALPGPFEDGFMGLISAEQSIRDLLMIPKHCELDFTTAVQGQELAVEVSGPLDRVVCWGKALVL